MTGPLTMDQLAAVIARDIPPGSFVNLGIGHPTKVADHLPPEAGVVLHTENGMLGMGPSAAGADVDPDLINAGKIPVTELPGAAYFDHASSFAMMRGGHLDFCVLGAYQVSAGGDLANWHTGAADDIPAVGGAMDLAIGAKSVFVMMSLFTRGGAAEAGAALHLSAHRSRLRVPRLHRPRRLRHDPGGAADQQDFRDSGRRAGGKARASRSCGLSRGRSPLVNHPSFRG